MNRNQRLVRWSTQWTRLFVAAGALLALSAWAADPPKPRVLVILDTSRSMKELPKFVNPGDIDIQIPVDPAAQGDYDPNLDNNCQSKFCAAKKVVFNVIPQYTEDARIGFTTYYQYVLNAEKNDTQQTSCFYDVLSPPNLVRTYTSFVDFTGSGTTVCAGGPADPGCDPSTRANTFPDTSASGSGDGLNGWCTAPSGYSSVTNPTQPGDTCTLGTSSGNMNCYTVTKTAALPGMPVTCDVGSYPVSLPMNVSSICTSTTYTAASASAPTIVGATTPLRYYVPLTDTTCSGTVVPPAYPPMGAPSLTLNTIYNTGSTVGRMYRYGNSLNCHSSAPCDFFLSSATPQVASSSNRSWYGFFTNSYTPAPAYDGNETGAVLSPYPFSNNLGGAGYVASVLAGTVNVPGTSACPADGRITSGSLAGFGINNALGTLDANVNVRRGSRTHETPTRSGTNFNCTPGWPCDVTKVSEVIVPGAIVPVGTVYASSPLTAGQSVTPIAADSFSLYATNGAGTCPSVGSIGPSANTPSGFAWSGGAPGGCTGTGLYACSFTAAGTGTVTAPGGTCTSPVYRSDGSNPGTCPFNGKSYTSSVQPNLTVTRLLPNGSTCPSSPGTITSAGQGTSAGTADDYTGCSVYPCTLSNGSPLQQSGPLEYSPWVSQSNAPSGFSGGYAGQQNRGSKTYGPVSASATGSCGASEQTSSSSTLCGGSTPCLLLSNGYKQVSPSGCGSENSACYACEYQPIERRWSRPSVQCNYTAPSVRWTVNRDALRCTYNRARWTLSQQQPNTKDCNYEVGARRYDFNEPTAKYCEYWAVRSTIESPRTQYTYQYLTKGDEIIGRASKSTSGLFCSDTYTAGSTLQTQCPASISDCSGLTPTTNAITPMIPSGASCKLQYGGTDDANRIGSRSGRYSRFGSNTTSFSLTQACEGYEATVPANPDSYKNRTSNPWGFCEASGSPAVMTRYLVSDWYSPATTNALSAYDTVFNPSQYTLTWSNTPTKEQGFGGKAGFPTGGSGALDHGSIFVPIPADGSYDPVAQRNAIRAAVSKCIPPNVTPPDATGRLAGGACVSDFENATAPGTASASCVAGTCSNNSFKSCTKASECWPWQDFTPLYGSLKNAHQYMVDRWTAEDDDQQCRDYFIVLATDGAENTPSGYTVNGSDPNTNVQGLVASFRETAVPRTRPDVKTFVIAFGENIGSLDGVASAGGTNQAFTANSLSELQTALEAVFTTITQGVYSRSRPALSTDGQRLYAAQYIRATNSPDWSGLLTAYRVAVDGSFTPAWEMADKMNDPSHPSRNISVGLRKKSDDTRVVGSFTTGNSELVDQIDDDGSFPWGMTSSDVIHFLRTSGDSYTGPGTRVSVLGPIVSSAPVVVSKSPYDTAWGGTTTTQLSAYSDFVADTGSRPTRVLFQANDAMLHAAVEGVTTGDCSSLGDSAMTCPNGQEAWAFVPGSLYRGWTVGSLVRSLYKLKQGSWNMGLLDGTLSVSDVCGKGSEQSADGCNDKSDWKTIAIGTERKGGRGVFAIDVTDGSAPSNTSDWLWDYWEDDLGYTYSVPAIGRVKEGGKDYFVSVFGGGEDDPNTWEPEGTRMYVLKATSGALIKKYTKFDKGSSENDITVGILARPATWRRPAQAYMDSAYVGAGQSLYTMRFAKPISSGGGQWDNKDKWKPDEFFDPTTTRNDKNSSNNDMPVRQVVETPGSPPTYSYTTVKNLPLTSWEAPSILNRPKMAALLVTSGAVPDLYVGTGDVRSPESPAAEFSNGNYFYAVHDKNEQPHGSKNDGVPMWVVKFPDKEQVVSEPAIISGCIVVATYTPPSIASGCGQSGDTILYGFHPLTGELTPCLTYPAGTPWAGNSTSVVKMTGVGIPSDLVVVNDNVYMSTSEGGLQRAPVRQVPRAGNVRSYRRIK